MKWKILLLILILVITLLSGCEQTYKYIITVDYKDSFCWNYEITDCGVTGIDCSGSTPICVQNAHIKDMYPNRT